jgi:hypothetical protein
VPADPRTGGPHHRRALYHARASDNMRYIRR